VKVPVAELTAEKEPPPSAMPKKFHFPHRSENPVLSFSESWKMIEHMVELAICWSRREDDLVQKQ
jgi:hypothetical protein